MEWTQTLTIIGVNIALITMMATLVIWAINKMDSDVKSVMNRMDGHAQRIDQLYHMFIDLVKDKKKEK